VSATGSPRRGPGPEVAAVLAYLGGAITGIMFLVVEKHDGYVRFHAMQSTITFLAAFVVHLVLRGVPVVGYAFSIVFVVALVGLWIFLMVKAFTGERYKLPYIGDWAEQATR
jgi:uncharacterized membrane protein